jgi:hypothetical protein
VVHVLRDATATLETFTMDVMSKASIVLIIDGNSGATSDRKLLQCLEVFVIVGNRDTDVWLEWPSVEDTTLKKSASTQVWS